MFKPRPLTTLTLALGALALAAAPGWSQTVRDRMKADPAHVKLYTVEFRSTVDRHRHLKTMRVFKVTGDHGQRVHIAVAPAFVAKVRARIVHILALPHVPGQRGPFYNGFLYSPAYPDTIIIDPDRAIDNQGDDVRTESPHP